MLRRNFLLQMSAMTAAAAAGRQRTIVVRSGWQTINIGDIAHTPGLLALLEKHIPDAAFVLWPAAVEGGTEAMLMRRFPKLRILSSGVDAEGLPESRELREVLQSADLFVHGSAASVSSQAHVGAWRKLSKKPYGFFGVGVTLAGEAAGRAMTPELKQILDESAFLFTRETASLKNIDKAGVKGPEIAFGPDGTFSMDIRDEARAEAFLRGNHLTPGKFVCVIPRLRYTPYHKIRKVDWSAEEIRRREQVNDAAAERDHAKLREAMVAYLRQTDGKVLLCPEMTYQIDIIDPLLYDPLPSDLKPRVVRRKTFWLPDEAASIYKRATAVVSCECHSPILSAVQGTPCMYVHQPEDGIKGQMWNDVGLGEWYFPNIDETTGADVAARLLGIVKDAAGSRKKVQAAVALAQRVQADRAKFIRTKVLADH